MTSARSTRLSRIDPRFWSILVVILGTLVYVNVAQADADAASAFQRAGFTNAIEMNVGLAQRHFELMVHAILEYVSLVACVVGLGLVLIQSRVRRNAQPVPQGAAIHHDPRPGAAAGGNPT